MSKGMLSQQFSTMSLGCDPRIVTPGKNKRTWPPTKLTRAQVGGEYTAPAFVITTGESQRQRNTVDIIREIQVTGSKKYCFRRWAWEYTPAENRQIISISDDAMVIHGDRHYITVIISPLSTKQHHCQLMFQRLWWRFIKWICTYLSAKPIYLGSQGYPFLHFWLKAQT